jgi:hypothetical protein
MQHEAIELCVCVCVCVCVCNPHFTWTLTRTLSVLSETANAQNIYI